MRDAIEKLIAAVSRLEERVSRLETTAELGKAPLEQDHMWELVQRVDSIPWSTRVGRLLQFEGINYIGDLVRKSEEEMLRTPNFARKSLNEVKEVLDSMGLSLGMKVPGWPPDNLEELSKRVFEAEIDKDIVKSEMRPGRLRKS